MSRSSMKGSLELVGALWRHLFRHEDGNAGEIFQTSLMTALLAGVYEGDVTYGEVRRHGDFGLGTFNDLDGEMVAIDAGFYQLRSDGSARPVSDDQKTPFAVVTFFRSEREIDVAGPLSKVGLLELIERATSPNLFSAVRVDGSFRRVRTRTVARQSKPFASLSEATEAQAEKSFADVRGTLAGFRSPPFAQGIGVAGFHLHFLREDRTAGGHALDYEIVAGKVRIGSAHDLHVELPSSQEFVNAKLDDPAVNEKIRKVEG